MIVFGGIEFPENCGQCKHCEVHWDGEVYAKCTITEDIPVFNATDTMLRLALDCRPNTCPYNTCFEIVRKVLDNVFDIIDDRSDAEELKQKILDKIYVRN